MLKLILPDVGPMPHATDWLSLTDEQLNEELISRGHKPRPHCASAIHKLVILERVELYNWLSAVAEHHGPAHSELMLLTPIIARRMAMGKEQLQRAVARYTEQLEQKTRQVAELEATIQVLLRVADELETNLRDTPANVVGEGNATQAAEAVEATGLNGAS